MPRIGVHLDFPPDGGGTYQYALSVVRGLAPLAEEGWELIAFARDDRWRAALPAGAALVVREEARPWRTAFLAWALNGETLTKHQGAPLRLAVQIRQNNVEISWPASAAGAALEFSPDLSGPSSWMAVLQPPVTSNNLSMVTLPAAGIGGFYRLATP